MAVQIVNRNIPEECHQVIKTWLETGSELSWIAFPPGGGDRWSVVNHKGVFVNRNIPEECHQNMLELSKGGARIVCMAFPPQGGNSWSIVNSNGVFANRNIPEECHKNMGELSKNGAKIVCVAFPPQGGNSWSIVNDQGVFANRNIPDECHQKMLDLGNDGAKITCVAFPPQGGNSWSVVNNRGGLFNRNISDDTHMHMNFFTSVYGVVRVVAFAPNHGGWSLTVSVTKAEKVCDRARCVFIAEVYRNIGERLNGKVVGYACTVGAASMGAYSNGNARTSANAPARLFLPSTKIPVASVAKFVTALAALRFLAKHDIGLNVGIGKYVPSDWTLNSYVKSITFRELMCHRSGIRDYGNNSQDFATLKAFFTKSTYPKNEIDPDDKSPCYSNYNFSIFRILMPVIEGFSDDSANRAAKFGAAYVKIVRKNVFDRVGAYDVDSKPPTSGPQASAYAFSYKSPGTEAGFDWGDSTPGVGASGWYLSIDDISKVLNSLNKNDGRIITPAQMRDMEQNLLGWDSNEDSTGYRWVQKNGGWGANGTTISTSVALFGPGVFGALFMNSDISGEAGVGAAEVLRDAYKKALKPRS